MYHKRLMMLGCVSSARPHCNQFYEHLVHPWRDRLEECVPCCLFLVEVLEDQAKPFQFVDSC
ncbi:hypothetical protein PVAP13_7KG077763 [Panicum virgatum]|uniref:Uncharacterized protein n=1 Tax=Panicum virgatum TaxID=38727 RepID=A0A8T0QK54_PANVG|nr:hypothetical protein PVAP13_7KG077763 [Panicum virgatum]